MNIGALVPARIGSKRLPRKNIKKLGGKPLICWTLDALLESGVFSSITVSTESEDVAAVVREQYPGGEVDVLMRPEELAGDDSPLAAVKAHYLQERPGLEWTGLFMPTMPFRKVATLRQIHAAILSGHPWAVKTCTTRTWPITDYYYPTAEGVKRFFAEPCFYARMLHCTYMLERTDAPAALWDELGLSHAERVFMVHADEVECLDVDTPEDFAAAEKVCQGLRPCLRQLAVHQRDGWRIVAPVGTDFHALEAYLAPKLDATEHPLLVLAKAAPPLTFLSLQDGAQRRPWLCPEANAYLRSPQLEATCNMAYMPEHYLHDQAIRIQRDLGAANHRKLGSTDVWGGFHGMDGSAIPMERVIMREDLEQQPFYVSPVEWV